MTIKRREAWVSGSEGVKLRKNLQSKPFTDGYDSATISIWQSTRLHRFADLSLPVAAAHGFRGFRGLGSGGLLMIVTNVLMIITNVGQSGFIPSGSALWFRITIDRQPRGQR